MAYTEKCSCASIVAYLFKCCIIFFCTTYITFTQSTKEKKSSVCLIYLDICASWKIMMERVFSFQNTFFPTLCNFIHTVIHNDLSSPLCFCPLFKAHLYALALYWYFFPSWGADSFLDFYWIIIVCVFLCPNCIHIAYLWYVTNSQKCCTLKQHKFTILQFLWVGHLGTAQLNPLLWVL